MFLLNLLMGCVPDKIPTNDSTEVVVQEAPPLYLPAGSIISGTLITGLDAPTHESARREPFPALLRIQKEAICIHVGVLGLRFGPVAHIGAVLIWGPLGPVFVLVVCFACALSAL